MHLTGYSEETANSSPVLSSVTDIAAEATRRVNYNNVLIKGGPNQR